MAVALEIGEWAQEQFGSCDLGDRRRTERMVKLATQMAAQPDASTPSQTETWADCKAAYRLFEQAQVTFDAVVAPQQALTRSTIASGTWLLIDDTTEINFGYDRKLTGVGRVGSADARGFYLHSSLAISPDREEIVGLAAQDLYCRPLQKITRVSSAQRKKKQVRETQVWGRVIDQVGPPADGAVYIHVCDRGADDFEIYCHLLQQCAGWVIRAAQLKRLIFDTDHRRLPLGELLTEQPLAGTYELDVPANQDQPKRTAKLEVRITTILMPRPKTGVTDYVKRCGITEIPMSVIEVREPNPPSTVKPLHWVLLTSESVRDFNDAWRIIGWYEKRQVIEEYHKCLKTGCRVEERLYQSGERLAPVIGLLSVLAVRLLQLKTVARNQPELPATRVVPKTWLKMLPLVSKCPKPIQTVREFFRRLAGLGGFLGRKHDGEPGWQTVWRGLKKLLLIVRGAEAYHEKCG